MKKGGFTPAGLMGSAGMARSYVPPLAPKTDFSALRPPLVQQTPPPISVPPPPIPDTSAEEKAAAEAKKAAAEEEKKAAEAAEKAAAEQRAAAEAAEKAANEQKAAMEAAEKAAVEQKAAAEAVEKAAVVQQTAAVAVEEAAKTAGAEEVARIEEKQKKENDFEAVRAASLKKRKEAEEKEAKEKQESLDKLAEIYQKLRDNQSKLAEAEKKQADAIERKDAAGQFDAGLEVTKHKELISEAKLEIAKQRMSMIHMKVDAQVLKAISDPKNMSAISAQIGKGVGATSGETVSTLATTVSQLQDKLKGVDATDRMKNVLAGTAGMKDFLSGMFGPGAKALQDATGLSKESQIMFRQFLKGMVDDYKKENPVASAEQIREHVTKMLSDESKLRTDFMSFHEKKISEYKKAFVDGKEGATGRTKEQLKEALLAYDKDKQAIGSLGAAGMSTMVASDRLGRQAENASFLRGMTNAIKISLTPIGEYIGKSPTFKMLAGTMKAVSGVVSGIFKSVSSVLGILGIVPKLIPLIAVLFAVLYAYGDKIWAWITTDLPGYLMKAVEWVGGVISDTFNWLASNLPGMIGSVADYLYEALGEWWSWAWEGVTGFFGSLIPDWLWTWLKPFGDSLMNALNGLWGGIKGIAGYFGVDLSTKGVLGGLGFDVGKTDDQMKDEGRTAMLRGGGGDAAQRAAEQEQLTSINKQRKAKGLAPINFTDYQNAKASKGSGYTLKDYIRDTEPSSIQAASSPTITANPATPSVIVQTNEVITRRSEHISRAPELKAITQASVTSVNNQNNSTQIQVPLLPRNTEPTNAYMNFPVPII